MEQLTALDAAFLEVEDSDPHVSLAVGGVSIMEGPAPSYDEFVSTSPNGCRQFRAAGRSCGLIRSISAHPNGWMTRTSTSRGTCTASHCHIPATTPNCSR